MWTLNHFPNPDQDDDVNLFECSLEDHSIKITVHLNVAPPLAFSVVYIFKAGFLLGYWAILSRPVVNKISRFCPPMYTSSLVRNSISKRQISKNILAHIIMLWCIYPDPAICDGCLSSFLPFFFLNLNFLEFQVLLELLITVRVQQVLNQFH